MRPLLCLCLLLSACSPWRVYHAGAGTLYVGDLYAVEARCKELGAVLPSTAGRGEIIGGCALNSGRWAYSADKPEAIAEEVCHMVTAGSDPEHRVCKFTEAR